MWYLKTDATHGQWTGNKLLVKAGLISTQRELQYELSNKRRFMSLSAFLKAILY